MSKLNLDYYRKQAKALLRAVHAGDAAAIERLKPYGDQALHVAQLAVAREQGFASWPKFQAFIIESRLEFPDLIDRFIYAATADVPRAWAMLKAHPELVKGGFYAWLVLGGTEGVTLSLAGQPDLVSKKSGPQKVEPLVYVCFSRFGHPKSPHAAKIVATAKILLDHGADPNAAFYPEKAEDGPLSCLYAASGLLRNPELTRLLLEAGATPDDNESLYHATENHDLSCLKLLLQYGANPNRH